MTGTISSARTLVAPNACAAIEHFATVCGRTLAPFADQVLGPLLLTASGRMFNDAAESCLMTLSTSARFNLHDLFYHWTAMRSGTFS